MNPGHIPMGDSDSEEGYDYESSACLDEFGWDPTVDAFLEEAVTGVSCLGGLQRSTIRLLFVGCVWSLVVSYVHQCSILLAHADFDSFISVPSHPCHFSWFVYVRLRPRSYTYVYTYIS